MTKYNFPQYCRAEFSLNYMVGAEGKVVAFELTPFTFDILRRNTSNTDNVITENLAVSNNEMREVTFLDYGAKNLIGNTIMNKNRNTAVDGKIRPKNIQVSSTSIDRYVALYPELSPHFIKIDAEGTEYLILEDAQNTINDHQPIITFETDFPGSKDWSKTQSSIDFLNRYGYRFFDYEEHSKEIVEIKSLADLKTTNIICLPNRFQEM